MNKRMHARDLYFVDSDASVDFDWDAQPQNEEYDQDSWAYWEHDVEPNVRRLKNVIFDSELGQYVRVTAKGEVVDDDEHDLGQPVMDGPTEGPMMNFYWPLGSYPRMSPMEMAWAVRHWNVCIVRVGDEYGIALTGGGMDLSWHLAAAAVAVGYAPWRQLPLGWGETDWEYGIATVGKMTAKRVRNALRYRLRTELGQVARSLRDVQGWK